MPASKAKKKKSGGAGLAVFNSNQLKQLRSMGYVDPAEEKPAKKKAAKKKSGKKKKK